MSDSIDYSFNTKEWSDVRTAMVKTFTFEPEAYLYVAQLRAAGFQCFITHSYTAQLTPFGYGNIRLFVRQEQADEALELIERLDRQTPPEESFHDATLEDIEYERRKREPWLAVSPAAYILILLVLALFISGWLFRMASLLFQR